MMCAELLLSGWLSVREEVMPKLQDLCQKQKQARFDVCSLLYFFEEKLPLAVLG